MCFEDLFPSTTLTQVNAPVLNVGSSVSVTPFLTAASDAAALAVAGSNPGDVYINTAVVPYRLRATQASYAAWTPTITTSGGMTVASFSVTNAMYATIGSITFVSLQVNISFGGTAQASFYVQGLPLSIVGITFSPIPAISTVPSTLPVQQVGLVQASAIFLGTVNASNFALGTVYTFYVNGSYRTA